MREFFQTLAEYPWTSFWVALFILIALEYICKTIIAIIRGWK